MPGGKIMYTTADMQRTQRILVYFLALTLGAVWIFLSGGKTDRPLQVAPQAGFAAPEFVLQTPEGEAYSLSKLKGRAVLVNLWATWCPPCRAEMPAIERVYREYKSRGFIALAVNATYQDDPAQLAPFIREYGLTFPILLDLSGGTGAAYELHALPSSFFINRDGVIEEVVIGGPMSEALLRARVERLLE
jgi:thiol-disulfide isomerase/thioredoxin